MASRRLYIYIHICNIIMCIIIISKKKTTWPEEKQIRKYRSNKSGSSPQDQSWEEKRKGLLEVRRRVLSFWRTRLRPRPPECSGGPRHNHVKVDAIVAGPYVLCFRSLYWREGSIESFVVCLACWLNEFSAPVVRRVSVGIAFILDPFSLYLMWM